MEQVVQGSYLAFRKTEKRQGTQCAEGISSSRAKPVPSVLKNGTLKTYKDFPDGEPATHAETISADLLAFLKG